MKNRKLLLLGKNGLLGSELYQYLKKSYELNSPTHAECDITIDNQVKAIFEDFKPDIVINATAFSDVDQCELNPEKANAVNFVGSQNIVKECKKSNCYYLTYSTDYVFDGEKKTPYIESDNPKPLNIYGESKLKAEKIIQDTLENYSILRVSWLYGMHRDNFLKLIIKSALKTNSTNKFLSIVDDQLGSPTSVMEIAAQSKLIIQKELTGLIHCSSQGITSRFEMTKMIIDYLDIQTHIEPCLLLERKHKASRPLYSCLENRKLNDCGFNIMKSSESALTEFLDLNRESLLGSK